MCVSAILQFEAIYCYKTGDIHIDFCVLWFKLSSPNRLKIPTYIKNRVTAVIIKDDPVDRVGDHHMWFDLARHCGARRHVSCGNPRYTAETSCRVVIIPSHLPLQVYVVEEPRVTILHDLLHVIYHPVAEEHSFTLLSFESEQSIFSVNP